MPTPIETVTAFINEWAKSSEALHASHHTYFTPTTVWENVGVITTVGIDEAIAFINEFEKKTGFATIRVDILNIAADGDKVLTERVDHFVNADGATFASVRIMGIFELENGKVARWRDYFDTAAMGPLA